MAKKSIAIELDTIPKSFTAIDILNIINEYCICCNPVSVFRQCRQCNLHSIKRIIKLMGRGYGYDILKAIHKIRDEESSRVNASNVQYDKEYGVPND